MKKDEKLWDHLPPGSSEARLKGCICPAMDNNNGEGLSDTDEEQRYWVKGGCPLHSHLIKRAKRAEGA